jgi:hypothetical protein
VAVCPCGGGDLHRLWKRKMQPLSIYRAHSLHYEHTIDKPRARHAMIWRAGCGRRPSGTPLNRQTAGPGD